jgi:Domain of unknown function (DUF4347)/Cadherin-like/RTX calcium-binding nonapeptide repeat (4 copies)/Bacterial cadherin-like domain
MALQINEFTNLTSDIKVLVVLDSSVEQPQQFIDAAIANVEVVILRSDEDGVEQITQALTQYQNIASIHIVSHGIPGSLQLGNGRLSLETLSQYASSLQQWFVSSTNISRSSLVLYGCNFAAGDAGLELVEKLHQITGAVVRASSTPVGHASLGGSWALDVAVGHGDIPIVFKPEIEETFVGVLPSYPDGDSYYRYVVNDGAVSFSSITGTGTRVYKATEQNAPPTAAKFNENDDGEIALTLPFSFNYYGTLITSITVGVNGGMILGTNTGVVSPNYAALPIVDPQTQKAIPAIFPYWTDLDLSQGGEIYFQSFGSAGSGNRTFVIEWNNVAHADVGDGITFQTILHEGSNEIQFIYSDSSFGDNNYDNGASATVGLSGVDGIEYSKDAPDLSGVNSIRFLTDPRLVTNTITISEGEELTLTNQHLKATDFDTTANNVTYTITNIQNGIFKLNNVVVAGSTVTFTQDDLNNNRVKFAHNGVENAPSFNINVNDPYQNPTPATVAAQITFVRSNDQPVLVGVSAPANILENSVNSTPVLIDADGNVTLSDSDSPDFNGGQLIVGYSSGGGTEDQLSIRSAGLVSFNGSLVSYNNVIIGNVNQNSDGAAGKNLVVTFNAASTATAIEAVIENLTYQNISNTPVAGRTLSIVVTDGDNGTSAAVSVPLTVTAENDAPVIMIPATQTIAEDTSFTFTGAQQIAIADVDAGNNWIQAILTATNGTLTFANKNGLNFVSGDGTSDTTMTVRGSVADINTALNTLSFNPNPNFNGSASVKVDVDDLGQSGANGKLTDSETINIIVDRDNDAPVNTVPGAQAVDEDQNLIFSGVKAIMISDVDAAESTGEVEVTLSVDQGALTLNSTTGLTIPVGTGTGDKTVRMVGSLANINAAISGLVYRGNQNFNGADTLTVTTSDLGNTGNGNILTDIDTVAITVNAVNDVPVNIVPGTIQNVSEDTNLVFSVANGNAIAINDVDAVQANAEVKVTLSVSKGTLTLNGDLSKLTFLNGDGQNDATMTFRGTVADINTSLSGLNYRGNLNINGSDTLTITTNDQGNTGSGLIGNTTSSVSINIAAVNNAPAVTGLTQTVAFAEQALNNSALIIDNTVNFADVDSSNFDGGFLRIAYSSGSLAEDQLSVRNQGTGSGQIGFSNGIVTFSGTQIGSVSSDGNFGSSLEIALNSNATVLAVKTLLENLTYQNTSNTPTSSRTITVTINDGDGATSIPVSTIITVNPFNDAPVQGNNSFTLEEGQLIQLNSNNLSATDVDSNESELVFEVINVQAGYFLVDGVRKSSFTQKDVTDGKVEFQHDGGEVKPSYELRIKDEVNTTLAGVAQIDFANENDVPTLLGLSRTVDFGATEANNQPVLIDESVSFADVDSPNFDGGYLSMTYSSGGGLEDQLSVRNQGNGSGQIGFNGTKVFYEDIEIGSVDANKSGMSGLAFQINFNNRATVAAAKALIENLTYRNTSDTPSDQRTLSLTVNDGDGGTSVAAEVMISIAPENDAPIITSPISATIDEDTSFTFIGNDVITIDDPDAGTSPVKVTLNAIQGSLTLSGTTGLNFSQGDGVSDPTLIFTGSLVNINNALEGMVFNPNAHFGGVASVQIAIDDLGNTGDGGAKTDRDTVSITVNAVNDAPQIQVLKNQSVNEDTDLIFTGTNRIQVTDVDTNGALAKASLTVNHGTLTLNGDVTGLNIITGSNQNSGEIVFEGTIADINAALDGMTYRGDQNFNGSDSLVLEIDDLGNSGRGGSLKTKTNVDINVQAINDAPINTIPVAQSVKEEAILLFSQSTGNAIRIGDVDINEGDTIAEVTLSVQNGSLTLVQTNGLSFLSGDGTTDGAMTFTGSIESLNAALNGMTYRGKQDFFGQDSLTITTSDRGNSGLPGVLLDVDNVGITVQNVNDAPVMTGEPVVVADEDKFYSFVPTVRDVDGDRLTFSINNKPVWATFDPTTGQLTGTPKDADVGVLNNLVISVSDGIQTVSLPAFNLTVLDDEITGTTGNDQLSGDQANNVIVGLGNNDVLTGLDGNDILYGDEGDDQLFGQNGDDILYGSVGTDLLDGGNGNDVIYGEAGSDRLLGDNGQDTIYGGSDNDEMYGGKDNDRLYGETGNDKVYGDEGDDLLIGSQGNDRLVGGRGNDILDGGNGNDILDGGSGRNKLQGGTGKDTFMLDLNGYALIKGFGGADKLAIVGRKKSFYNQLEIKQQGKHTVIDFGDQIIAKLLRVNAEQITIADFKSI